ncbi:enoyl-CoA hydratase-related protein [Pseudorhizobium flavum]|jgi:2-(1,2-epoxy-1,2-dihydrophenyl)acetyl-CoA isomerase|uniref:2-(1,2-epoxy-1,2-dihydrophenyl)acetyl-CoA isomerase n=1 Tax=Pseudorhizobium flavum TaxID=1335061 RepID=A0A7W9Z0T0_9HYPH|nr:enoyl-CoA hydratase-related protein [Pseudorhizobium flavum]EGP53994.1 enoyl-CoA hydratase [Agrobacterium tumefaciens F2]MBB6181958.1 2-(1,2-epoxy-1,2-dihydrophenyl)acetyl-CoA isomerase [Pseudorhizobium flavum]CAD6631391.1 2-(1,2-epoxy-1,2-dihydrophenyl)acetyl-CoA isomerase [Pseudorhizobium flavum]
MEDLVILTTHEGWSQVTLNRPDRLNALNEPMLKQLTGLLGELAADSSCRAVLITGAGRAFCAGQDLTDCVPGPDGPTLDLADIMERLYNPLVLLLRSMPKPVLCAVNGVAAGGGANVALAGDIVLAAYSAKFTQAFAKIGLIPDCGGTWLLPRLIGDARARALALLAQPVDAQQAENWGMIWRAVPDADLMMEAETLARYLAAQPTETFGLLKQALAASATNDLANQLDLERELQAKAAKTPDFTEGLNAFFDKRTPRFSASMD